MSLGACGAVVVFLIVCFIIARIWFNVVEGCLSQIKKLLCRRQKPPAWHTLTQDDDEEAQDDRYR